MRFARFQCEHDSAPPGLEEFVASSELDFLQLDYLRTSWSTVEPGTPVELPDWPRGFIDALRIVARSLFLEPDFCVVASSGWADAFGCVENSAKLLVESGCRNLPVAAVRGSNLLPILDMLADEGVDLKHADTGAPWRELRAPLLAADLQLGAGPVATALSEDARLIVVGCYDGTAPAAAMAVRKFKWSWKDYNRLAAAALAARAAAWVDWECAGEGSTSLALTVPWHARQVVLSDAGEATVELAAPCGEDAARRLQDWLTTSDDGTSIAAYADARVDFSRSHATVGGPHQIAIGGAAGSRPDGAWRLEVLYQTGFSAEAMVEFDPSTDPRLRRYIAKTARKQLRPAEDSEGMLSVKELQPLGGATGAGWLHLAYQSKSQKACRRFADQALKLASAYRPFVRLASGVPAVQVQCAVWPARVPRDAVDVAVETRLAYEWI